MMPPKAMKSLLVLLFAILPLAAHGEDVYQFTDSAGNLRRIARTEGFPPHLKRTQKSGGSWQLWYIAMETRSEGLHGELRDKDGNLIQGEKIRQELTIDGVVYVWWGEFKDRKHLFSASGWLDKNVEEYQPARKLIGKDKK